MPQNYVYTILDRFLSDEDSPLDAFSVGDYKRSIQRDLQNMLNTRQILTDEQLGDWKQVRASLLAYGLRDLYSGGRVNKEMENKFSLAIIAAIQQYEPRLVRPVVKESVIGASGEMKFKIEAMARMLPQPERLVFATTLNLDTMSCDCTLEGDK